MLKAMFLTGRLGFNIGNFYNGTRRGFELRLDLRLTGRFSLEPRYEFNRITLPDGSFDTNVFGGRVGLLFLHRPFYKTLRTMEQRPKSGYHEFFSQLHLQPR